MTGGEYRDMPTTTGYRYGPCRVCRATTEHRSGYCKRCRKDRR